MRRGQGTVIGKVYGGYEVTRRIGSGTFGVIYEGKSDNKKAAIKFVKDVNMGQLEVDILSSLKECIHVPQILFSEIHDGKLIIGMEMGLADVGELLEQNPKNEFCCDTIGKLLYQVVLGLEVLHIYGILHRDVKSDNLLVSMLDSTKTVKVIICDYGLSYRFEAKDSYDIVGIEKPSWIGKRIHDSAKSMEHKRHECLDDLTQLLLMTFFWSNCCQKLFGPTDEALIFKKEMLTAPGIVLPTKMKWLSGIFYAVGSQVESEKVDYDVIKNTIGTEGPNSMHPLKLAGTPGKLTLP